MKIDWPGIILLSLGYLWGGVELAAGQPFDATVLIGVTVFAHIKWLEAMR